MTNLLSVFSSMLLSLAMFLESFCGCFGTFSGTERPSLVKLPTEERVVKLLPALVLFVLHTTRHVSCVLLEVNLLSTCA